MIQTRLARLCATLLLLGSTAAAQQILSSTSKPDGNGGTEYTVDFGGGPTGSMIVIIPDLPYSIEKNIKTVLPSPNGAQVATQVPFLMYRDSQGRRRIESFLFAGQYGAEGLKIVEIRDWVGQYEYTLDTVNHVAHRMKLPASLAVNKLARTRTDNPAAPQSNPRQSVTVESLGAQIIDGFVAEGRRSTTTVPAGVMGNDQPLVSVDETWTCSTLEPGIVRADSRDLTGTETIQSLVNVSHTEPNAALFQVPPDYKIVDEDGPFTIVVTKQNAGAGAPDQTVRQSAPEKPHSSFGVATATFPVKDAVGHTVRFSGWIRTQEVRNGYAGLWWRVDAPERGKLPAFDNSQARIIDDVPAPGHGTMRGAVGTTAWKRYEIELPVPSGATNINFGLLFTGTGSAWFDALRIELDGVPYINPQLFDLDFESIRAKGFYTGGGGYKVGIDNTAAWSGSQSLKMQFIGGEVETRSTVLPIGITLKALDPATVEGIARSTDHTTRVPINFINRSSSAVDIYWIDYDGNRVLYRASLAVGAGWQAGTYLTHPWLVVASGTGGTTKHDTGVRLAAFEAPTSAGGDAIITDRR